MRNSAAWPRSTSGSRVASMRSTRSRHSPISDNICQMGANATVSLAPISASPSGENAQSSAARTLSSSRAQRATSSRLNQALEPAAMGETRSRKYSAWRRTAPGYSPSSVSFSKRIGAYRFQQTPSRWRRRIDVLAQRFGDEAGQLLDERLTGSAHAAHGLHGLEREPRREDSKVTQQTLLLLRQQLVAPVERGSQGPVLLDRGAAPAGQQSQSDRAGRRRPAGFPTNAARAAANSMASGMPSSCRQISAIDGRSPGCAEKPASSAFARVTNSSTALQPRTLSGVSCPGAGTSSAGTR